MARYTDLLFLTHTYQINGENVDNLINKDLVIEVLEKRNNIYDDIEITSDEHDELIKLSELITNKSIELNCYEYRRYRTRKDVVVLYKCSKAETTGLFKKKIHFEWKNIEIDF